MRNILFKGKAKLDGKWVYGLLDYTSGGVIDIINYFTDANDSINGYKSVKVMPETIGQFTGETDENNVKVFEGDIISYLNSSSSKGITSVIYFKNLHYFAGEDYFEYIVKNHYFKVIGNIHDNK